MHRAAQGALAAFDDAAAAFAGCFGRRHAPVEGYRSDDAEIVLFLIGSYATKAMDAVDRMRAEGWPVGLLRLRLLRPYPAEAVRRALAGKQGVAVVDQDLSLGKGGVLHAELCSALYGQPDAPPILASFVGGLGGRDISAEEFREMVVETRRAVEAGRSPEPRLLYTARELREMRKLQGIAVVERAAKEEVGA
jgi:pyruvate ferredoxin oxidoreductase alpha subunit